MARSLNRVQLIGNLTRDPELRYTPSGAAVCSFSIATNRNWTTDAGEKREEAEFHRIVAWNKLAELCSQFLVKGRKVYVEGRLANRNWTAQDGSQKNVTEVVIDDMILLDSRKQNEAGYHPTSDETASPVHAAEEASGSSADVNVPEEKKDVNPANVGVKKKAVKAEETSDESVSPDDIPF